jgi:Glycosyltransferase family 87
MNKRWWLAGFIAIAFALWLRLFLNHAERPNFSDFRVYWVAGNKAAEHLTVYDVQGHYQFKYSPFIALLWAIPTHFRSEYLWSRLHYVVTGIGWYALIYWLARKLDPKRALLLWAAACVVFSVAVRDELKLGQVNIWPFLLVLPAWFAGRRSPESRGFDRNGFWIGAAWGFAVQWKLYALLLGPLWLLRRRPAVFAGAIAVTVLTLGAGMAIAHGPRFALEENLRWVASLTASSQELLISQYNVSILGVLGKAAQAVGIPFGAWAYLIWLGALALGLLALAWGEQAALDSNEENPWFWPASFIWALVAVVNPLVWPYWQLLAVPLFLIYFARGTEQSWRGDGPVFWAVVACFTLANWLQNTSVVHYGAGLLGLLVLLVDAYRQARARSIEESNGDLPSSPLSASSSV